MYGCVDFSKPKISYRITVSRMDLGPDYAEKLRKIRIACIGKFNNCEYTPSILNISILRFEQKIRPIANTH